MRKLVFLFAILMIPSLVLAGTISLTTSVTTDVLTTGNGEIQVTLTNHGDEAAYNVQLSLITDYFSSNPVHVGTLEVNRPFDGNISVNANGELKEGNYPVVLMTEYADANGYPFSSVSPITLTYKNPYPSRLSGVFENIELSGKRGKNLVLKLKNMDQVSHDVDVRLILPNELSSDVTQSSVELGSKKEEEVVFKVSNFAGLEGSTYVVLAVIEYEDDYHYSSLGSGMVRIVERKNIFKLPEWVPITGLILALFTLVFYLLKNKLSINFVREKNEDPKR